MSKRKGPKAYADLADLPEDDRIRIIGTTAMGGNVVGFFVDDERGKPDRYINKLLKWFPTISVMYRGPGPIKGVILIKVGPPGRKEGDDAT